MKNNKNFLEINDNDINKLLFLLKRKFTNSDFF